MCRAALIVLLLFAFVGTISWEKTDLAHPLADARAEPGPEQPSSFVSVSTEGDPVMVRGLPHRRWIGTIGAVDLADPDSFRETARSLFVGHAHCKPRALAGHGHCPFALEQTSRPGKHFHRRNVSESSAICTTFGSYCSQALRVARCESGYSVWARNGQYLGLFQMGTYARARYGHSNNAWGQARAAYRYFIASGRDWSPWSCKPW